MTDPMKQILSIYETCRNTYAIAHLDDFAPPQCEAPGHDTDTEHHAGVAEFLFFAPCGCNPSSWYLCAPATEWLRSEFYARCGLCGVMSPSSTLTFIPIGGKS